MNCRHCESDHVISQGMNMKCKNCGKTSVKIARRTIIPTEDRPSCPECGSPNPYSCGVPGGIRRWSCRSCGRYYSTQPKIDKAELSIIDSAFKHCMEVQVE